MSIAVDVPIQFVHSIHEHGLFFQELGGDCDVACSICLSSVKGKPAYHCADCGFFLHKFCAELPSEIRHPFHPEHMLDLRAMTASLLSTACCCMCCQLMSYGGKRTPHDYLFVCVEKGCRVAFHVACAALTLTVATTSASVPLVIFNIDIPCPITCKLCKRRLFGQVHAAMDERFGIAYGTLESYMFAVHESCALAPKNFKNHPLHLEHPLTAVRYPDEGVRCGVCNSEIIEFACKCDECSFFLDMKCVSFIRNYPRDDDGNNSDKDQIREIRHFSHPHPLTHLQVQPEIVTDFLCALCRKHISNNEFCYCLDAGCRDSRFMVHKTCAELPQEIIHPLHHRDHPLIYVNEELDCSLCGSSGSIGFKCQDCPYGLEVECALETLSDPKVEQVVEIQLIHEHPMRLRRNNSDDAPENASCHVCKEAAAGLVYACEEPDCDVEIHQACAEVKRESSDQSIHPRHPIILLSQPSDKASVCSACLGICSDFTFYCDYCKIYFHPRCVMMKASLKHHRHEHKLTHFRHMNGKSVQCNVCYDDCKVDFYRCVPCNYNLHYGCRPLPPSVKHEWHIHTMELRGKYINDTFDDQYCDLCETLRHPECGVYVCEECRCAVHIDCVIPRVNLEKGRMMEELELVKLDEQISDAETEIKAMKKKLERSEKDLEVLKAKKQAILSSRIQ